MKAEMLEKYLHDHLPLSAAMEAEVVEVSEGAVSLRAPLESAGEEVGRFEGVFVVLG